MTTFARRDCDLDLTTSRGTGTRLAKTTRADSGTKPKPNIKFQSLNFDFELIFEILLILFPSSCSSAGIQKKVSRG